MKTYITFGQVHIHRVNNKTFDKDTVAVINHSTDRCGRDVAFELFGDKFHNEYSENTWSEDLLDYFPKGLVEVE